MALLHNTTLTPSKLELITEWAPRQPWFAGDAAAKFAIVGSFRFDDPDGQVGIETIFVRAGNGPVLQVPLTYRNDPVPNADHFLVGTMQHGVLGKRWTYDAAADACYLGMLATVALTGDSHAELYYEENGKRTIKQPNSTAKGSGAPGTAVPGASDDHLPEVRNDATSTYIETDRLSFLLARQPLEHPLTADGNAQTVTGTWIDQPEAALLAQVFVRG